MSIGDSEPENWRIGISSNTGRRFFELRRAMKRAAR